MRYLTHWLQLQLVGGVFDGKQEVASSPLWETHRPHILQHSPPDPAAGPVSLYGLGWNLEYYDRGRLLVWHEGDFSEGIATGATLLQAAELGIVALVNSAPGPVCSAIPRALLETVTHGEPVQDWIGTIERGYTAFVTGLLAHLRFGVAFVIGFDGVAEAVRVLLITGNPAVEPTTFTRVAGS